MRPKEGKSGDQDAPMTEEIAQSPRAHDGDRHRHEIGEHDPLDAGDRGRENMRQLGQQDSGNAHPHGGGECRGRKHGENRGGSRTENVSLMGATLVIALRWRYICHFKST